MGEGKAIVIINNSYCYLIESGHNNSAHKAMDMAIEKHKENVQKEVDSLKNTGIKDDTGHPAWLSIETDIDEIKVFWIND